VARDERVDVLRLQWYVDSRREPDDVPQRWLALCREHLPQALPRRFGATEPLRGRLDRDGDAAFVHAFAEAETLLHTAGEPPCLGGSLGTRRRPVRIGPMTSHQLDIRFDAATADPGVRSLFEAVAEAFGTVFASASVRRDLLWTGRTLVVDRPDPDEQPYLAPLGQWLGLPPRPPLWAWFGPGYRRLVPRHREREWVPRDLVARLDEPEPARRRARRLPRGLGGGPLWWAIRRR
jgi:hypothetical protein